MRVIAFDSTAPRLTVGLAEDSQVIGQWDTGSDRQRGNTLDRLIDQALGEAHWKRKDIEGIGLVTGPGSLTAARIGWATASGWAVANDIRVVGWPVPHVQWQWWLKPNAQGHCRLTRSVPPAGSVFCLIHHRGPEFYAYHLTSEGPAAQPEVVVPGEWQPDTTEGLWIIGPALIADRDRWVASLPENANLVEVSEGIIGGGPLAVWASESLRQDDVLRVEKSPLDYGLPPDFRKAS